MTRRVESIEERAAVKQKRERDGRRAEAVAAVMLRLKGYAILARRWSSPLGEIDIIAVSRGRLHFVEVKLRSGLGDDEAHAAVSSPQARRIHAAAELWLARHPAFREHDLSFDLVLVAPWQWPRHIVDAL